MGLVELRYGIDRPLAAIERAQLYTFVDGGTVHKLDQDTGDGALVSAGGGVRAELTRTLGANVELAVPLGAPRASAGHSAKVNLRVSKSF